MSRTLFDKTPTMEVYWDDDHRVVRAVPIVPHHDVSDARENIEAIARLRDHKGLKRVRVLVDLRKIRTLTRQARTLYGSAYMGSVQRATALLTGSTVSRVVASFFMGLNKPVSPMRMFDDEDAALAWLAEYSYD